MGVAISHVNFLVKAKKIRLLSNFRVSDHYEYED